MHAFSLCERARLRETKTKTETCTFFDFEQRFKAYLTSNQSFILQNCYPQTISPQRLFLLQVRRWMRNPKVNVDKAQGKGLLYPCPKCPLAEDLWYTHVPSPYGCCHYANQLGGHYYQQEPCSPCPASGQTSGHDKSKGCKVKWKVYSLYKVDDDKNRGFKQTI